MAVGLVVLSTAPLLPLLYAPTTLDAEEVVWLRYMWLPIYAATVFLAAWHFRSLGRALPAFIPTALLVAFAAASMAWSIAPDVTLRRVEALAFNSLLAFYLAARFSWRGLMEILAASFLILAVGSLALCLAAPSLGVHSAVNAGAWRGLWPEKNELGFLMVIGAQSCLACAILDGARRRIWVAGVLLCAAMVFLSRSGTSLLCLLGSVAVTAGLVASRKNPVLAIGVAFVCGCVALVLAFATVLDLPLLLDLMGKDPTLTGRTDVWAAVTHRIADRPVLGFGYAAFWHNIFGPALLIRQEAKWAVPSAHNGWLEVLLQLGWVGAVLAGGYFALTFGVVVRRLRSRPDGFWAIMYVGAFAAMSFSESEIERQNSLKWILFAATSIKLLLDLAAPAASQDFRKRTGAPAAEPAPAPAAFPGHAARF